MLAIMPACIFLVSGTIMQIYDLIMLEELDFVLFEFYINQARM